MSAPRVSFVNRGARRRWCASCSTFIAGSPGRTEDGFQMLLHWFDEAKIDGADACDLYG